MEILMSDDQMILRSLPSDDRRGRHYFHNNIRRYLRADLLFRGWYGEQRQGMRILRQKYGERQEDGDRTRGQQANPLSLYYFCKGVH